MTREKVSRTSIVTLGGISPFLVNQCSDASCATQAPHAPAGPVIPRASQPDRRQADPARHFCPFQLFGAVPVTPPRRPKAKS